MDVFKPELTRAELMVACRGLDSYRNRMQAQMEDVSNSAAERAACGVEADEANALRQRLASLLV